MGALIKKSVFLSLIFLILTGWLALAGLLNSLSALAQGELTEQSQEDRTVLESQLADLEKQIDEHEIAIVKYQKQGQGLKSEINKLNVKIGQLNLKIKAVNLTLENLDHNILKTENKIKNTDNDLKFNKSALAEIIQSIYENERKGLAEIFLANKKMSDFFSDLNSLAVFQEKMRLAVKRIAALKEEFIDQKEQLSQDKNDAVELKRFQAAQKANVEKNQKDKKNLLLDTKGKESKFQELLIETKKTAAQIRSRIFEFLGGGELSFERAYEFAKFAEQATNIKASLILAILDRESLFGQNVGRCNYEKAMNPQWKDSFLALLQALKSAGINPPEPIMVSCPNRDGYFGGAMGPAQFIPPTWDLYKAKISEITGNNPANPWNNGDAFIATALYLKDAIKLCGNYSGKSLERCAAARYYAGKRWQNYIRTYGDRVAVKAEAFQKDIDILNN